MISPAACSLALSISFQALPQPHNVPHTVFAFCPDAHQVFYIWKKKPSLDSFRIAFSRLHFGAQFPFSPSNLTTVPFMVRNASLTGQQQLTSGYTKEDFFVSLFHIPLQTDFVNVPPLHQKSLHWFSVVSSSSGHSSYSFTPITTRWRFLCVLLSALHLFSFPGRISKFYSFKYLFLKKCSPNLHLLNCFYFGILASQAKNMGAICKIFCSLILPI